MSSAIINKRNYSNQNLLIIILGLILFVPPFFRGLFPLKSWLSYDLIIVFFLGAVLIIQRKEIKIRLDAMAWTTLFLIGSYLIAAIFAAYNKGGAYIEILRLVGYFSLFYLCKTAVVALKDVKKILNFLYWSGVGASFISLGTAFGTFDYPGAFLNGRLYSTLQYPNTFAAYMISLVIPGTFLYITSKNRSTRLIYMAGNTMLLFGFFSTISRGGYLTLLLMAIIFFVGLSKEYRFNIFVYAVYLFTVVFFISNKIISDIPGHSFVYYWLGLLLAIFLGVVPELIKPGLSKFFPERLNKVFIYGPVILLVIIALFSVGLLYNEKIKQTSVASDQKNSQSIISRATEARNVKERIVFYKDALKVFKDYPLLGTGGEGWNSVYRQYQPYNYNTSLIHSQYLQVLIEAGIIGLVAYMAIWYFFLSGTARLIKSNHGENRFFIWAVTCGALALGFHSMVDFNLSIPSVSIVLWSFWGMMSGMHDKLTNKSDSYNSYKLIKPITAFSVLTAGVGLAILLMGTALVSAMYTEKGVQAYNSQRYSEAEQKFSTALKFNPLNSENYAHLAKIYMIKGVDYNNRKELQKSLSFIDKALWLERNNPEYRTIKGKTQLNLDQIQEGVKEFETANKLTPFVQKFTDELEEIYFLVGNYYLLKGDKKNAQIYFEKAIMFPVSVKERIDKIEPQYKELQKDSDKLTISENILSKQDEAKKLLVLIK